MEFFQLSLIIAYCCIICLHLLTIDAISYSKIILKMPWKGLFIQKKGCQLMTPLDGFCVDAVLLFSLTLQCDFVHYLAELVGSQLGINLCGGNVLVSQQSLNFCHIGSLLHMKRAHGMT